KQTRVVFGNFGQAKRLPLILLTLDTIELAPKPVRDWLPEIRNLPGGRNTLQFSMVVVLAGRSRQTGVLETPLLPLSSSDSETFVREYASYLLRVRRQRDQPHNLERIITTGSIKGRLASLGLGIPLLLQILVETMAVAPDTEFADAERLSN